MWIFFVTCMYNLIEYAKGNRRNFFLLAILAGVGTISAVSKGYGYSSRFKGNMSFFWMILLG
jgi:hypothetical protein